MKRDFRILTEIGNLLYKEKNKPIQKEQKENDLFPLSLFARKGSFLNQNTYDYLNSISPKNLKVNLNETNSNNTLNNTNTFAINDVLYQYLKTFSIFNNRKNGILIKYNQNIGYNFNSKNILLRGTEQKSKSLNSLKGSKGLT
jgi:hypothetical protein